ncbi:hypothetical protein [Phaeovulum sp.]|uniref:hypothetical protein n=1 Tax=Phaeovulum sp. TaxID=2934796 RepID=UPI003569BD42
MKSLTILLCLFPVAALAHPEGHADAGVFHFLTQPDHLAMLAAGVAVVAFAAFKLGARR